MSHARDQRAFRLPRPPLMDWRSGDELRLAMGDASLEARCRGPAPHAAPTLVLLHEGLGSAGLWRDFPARLAKATGWGALAWSRQGYGASDPCTLPRPLDYMEREATRALPAVLAATGFRRGVLIGHSDGASIAALYAGSVADRRIRGLVLLAPHFFVEEVSISAIAAARDAFEAGDLRARLARHHADPDVAFGGWCDAWLDPAFRTWDITAALDHIRVPVLAIQGADDEYGTPAQLAALDAVPAPVEAHLLPGCRHAPHLDRPDETLALVADFIARLQRIEAAGRAP